MRKVLNRLSARSNARKSLELFAGAGGLGIGLASAGFVPQLVVEHDKWCCDTLRDNHGALCGEQKGDELPWRVVQDDVRQVSFVQYEGKIDLVSGGPPCQPFSLGGQHRAFDDARDMFPQAIRAVRETRPRAFIFENVKGLTRSAFLPYFEYVKLQLEHPGMTSKPSESWQEHLRRLEQHHTSTHRPDLHYQVVTKLLNSANYGVPQRRERVIFVGFRDDVDARWSFAQGDNTQEALVWDQLFGTYWDRHRVAKSARVLEGRALQLSRRLSRDEKPSSSPWRTTRDAICNLSEPAKSETSSSILNHRYQPNARIYPGHTGSYIDEPSKTLKAGVHGVPGGENMLRRADGSVRYFTVREAARIQTFPDAYKFHGAWSECMRQLGNAVPAELARLVGKSVAARLDDSELA
ncbi:DNA cytosine methyltransferase [Loktanella sp. M215]|uniref:DNA cytosine methyltransferase n=1 Tax=Loktanella sp. M215 TaxID=2675431 RepID=UPI001F46FDB5|nr:DNA cytosine methyltransferase [Loktanella sp. M215]MCF7698909.1 DNA (cytosine-5-)-methyltransferase [Loktanella sp. M215]